MKSIWKFPIKNINDNISIEMPKDSYILTIRDQQGTACIWAIVDSEKPLVKRNFLIRGTGHDIENLSYDNYIGTFQLYGGSLVFHVFENNTEL